MEKGPLMNTNGHELDSTAGADQVMAEVAKISWLAIVALVLGIWSFSAFGLILLSGIIMLFGPLMILPKLVFWTLIFLPLICGMIALVKISRSGGKLKGKGFAIVGILTSIMVLPILMPLMGRANSGICFQRLREIGYRMGIYASKNNNEDPAVDKWCDLLIAEADANPVIFNCPIADKERPCRYAINENITKFDYFSTPKDMVWVFESRPGWNLSGGAEILTDKDHFGGGINIMFGDGHSEFVKREDFGSLNWTGEE